MNEHDHAHIALPKLVGQPAYARPQPVVAHVERPFDPDDLPIAAALTEDERAALETLPAAAWRPGGGVRVGALAQDGPAPSEFVARSDLRARPFSLRSLTSRLRGGA